MPGLTTPLFKVFMAESAHAAPKPVLESGRQVAEFESRLAAWLGAPDAVALGDFRRGAHAFKLGDMFGALH